MGERGGSGRRVSEAGAIAVRLDRAEPQYLLVTAKADPAQWIFPKGHVESGETPADAARRELLEEAGVEGRALGEVGRLNFRFGEHDLEVVYFRFELESERPSSEGREKVWLPFAAAAQRLSFDDARHLLTLAHRQIERSA